MVAEQDLNLQPREPKSITLIQSSRKGKKSNKDLRALPLSYPPHDVWILDYGWEGGARGRGGGFTGF